MNLILDLVAEFMNNENSYLLDVEKMDDANEDGHKWATVSKTHLREQMSKCLEDRADAQHRATLARSSVVGNFDVHAAAQKAIARLLEIQTKLPQVKASRPQQSNTNSRFNFGQDVRVPLIIGDVYYKVLMSCRTHLAAEQITVGSGTATDSQLERRRLIMQTRVFCHQERTEKHALKSLSEARKRGIVHNHNNY